MKNLLVHVLNRVWSVTFVQGRIHCETWCGSCHIRLFSIFFSYTWLK